MKSTWYQQTQQCISCSHTLLQHICLKSSLYGGTGPNTWQNSKRSLGKKQAEKTQRRPVHCLTVSQTHTLICTSRTFSSGHNSRTTFKVTLTLQITRLQKPCSSHSAPHDPKNWKLETHSRKHTAETRLSQNSFFMDSKWHTFQTKYSLELKTIRNMCCYLQIQAFTHPMFSGPHSAKS